MASSQIIPTRMELNRIKAKLLIARKGHKLLKNKRDELMRQFLAMAKENMALRRKVEAGIKGANLNFVIAKAGMDEQSLNGALMVAKQRVKLEADQENIMSVNIPRFQAETETADKADIFPYGFAFTSGDLDSAVESLQSVTEDMIELAEKEKACQLMAAEIEKTRRRVNALEHVIIPEAQEHIRQISMKLEETARDNTIRLIKVKDMVLEDAHHFKEKNKARYASQSE